MDIVQRSVPDGPVAKVGDVNITREDFLLLYRSELQRRQLQSVPDVARVQLALMVLRSLIEQELLYQEAVRRGLTVSDTKADAALQDRLDQLRKGFSSQEGRDVSESELLEKLGYVDKSELRDNVRRLLMVEAMRAKIIEEDGLDIDDARVEEIYNETKDRFTRPGMLHLKQIYFDSSADAKAARKKADRALATVFSGQRFEAVAKQYSESPDASKGGDLGAVPERELPPFLVDAAEGLEPGDVSDVITSDYGCHIVMLVDRKPGQSATKEQACAAIRRQLAGEKEKTAVYSYCDDLIANGVYVKIYLELEENLRRLGGAEALDTQ
jgi:parvulin-like peptidyl-prolyl isomerase